MAKPQKIHNKDGSISYKIQLYKKIPGNPKPFRDTRVFSTRALAIAWYDKRMQEIERASIHGEQSNLFVRDLIEQYQDQFAANYGRSKNYDIGRLLNYPIADLAVNKLMPKHIIAHCIERNTEAKPQTVHNDLIWLRTIIKTMTHVNGIDFDMSVFDRATTVLRSEKLIAKSTERTRRPTRGELWRLSRHFYKSRSKIPMLHIMWFAVFSARRMSEVTRLEWGDNNPDRLTGMVRDAKHPRDKKGNHKRFKYTRSAWKIVCRQPKIGPYIFPYNPQTVGETFKRACKVLGIKDLHFHDLRHEGTSRLFESGYSIEQVQLFTLHDSWSTLKRYTHLKPEDID
jgi:integrase